jgi:hypothetical protein
MLTRICGRIRNCHRMPSGLAFGEPDEAIHFLWRGSMDCFAARDDGTF